MSELTKVIGAQPRRMDYLTYVGTDGRINDEAYLDALDAWLDRLVPFKATDESAVRRVAMNLHASLEKVKKDNEGLNVTGSGGQLEVSTMPKNFDPVVKRILKELFDFE